MVLAGGMSGSGLVDKLLHLLRFRSVLVFAFCKVYYYEILSCQNGEHASPRPSGLISLDPPEGAYKVPKSFSDRMKVLIQTVYFHPLETVEWVPQCT